MAEKHSVLDKILAYKHEEIARNRAKTSVETLKDYAAEQGAPRGFSQRLKQRVAKQQVAIVAEIKRASPSKGVLCENFDPLKISHQYMAAGATCLSVLTDRHFFKGSGAILDLVRRHCTLPALRKDFIIDEYQVYESKALGADCALLIIAALPDDGQLQALFAQLCELNIDVLVEVHNDAELDRALALGDRLELIGINNRNLTTFETDLDTTIKLAKQVPPDKLILSESGINQRADIARLMQHGIYAYLIGEALMTAADPTAKLKSLLAPNS